MTQCLVLVDICAKLFDKWTKDVYISSALEPNFPLDRGL